MSSLAKENLDERIERIRKRTEEIEKKHREAEEDRLMALKDNAMVKTTPPKTEDWPIAHKYDKLDFTYDVPQERRDEKTKTDDLVVIKPKRDYKKFAEGEGPPPDPAYNFLADAERDGKEQLQTKTEKIEKRDGRHSNSHGANNGRNSDEISGNISKNKDHFHKRSGQQSNSFRNRGNHHSNSNGNGGKPQQQQQQQHNRYQRQHSQPEYEQWRSEKTDDNRINNRQKSNVEKWRRGDWESNDVKHEKNHSNESPVINKSPKHITASKNTYPNNQHHHQQQYPQQKHSNGPTLNPIPDDMIEKRGNIMVSVSPGEVKSVKLTSGQVIGSGRVGPRQQPKPHFHIQTIEKEQQLQRQLHQGGNVAIVSPHSQRKFGQQQQYHNKTNNYTNHINNNYHQEQNIVATVQPVVRQKEKRELKININAHPSAVPNISPIYKSPAKDTDINITQHNVMVPAIPTNHYVSTSPKGNLMITAPVIGNNKVVVNSFLPSNTPNAIASNDDVTIAPFIAIQEKINVDVLAVAKELSNKPEFAKKSVQDRLLRIRQINQPDLAVNGPAQELNATVNNNFNNGYNKKLQNNGLIDVSISEATNPDKKNDCINTADSFVACT